MEAIISRTTGLRIEPAWAEWLKATRKLARIVLKAVFEVLVNTSRAGLLVRNGGHRRLRQLRP